jgi:hypothetical protein
LIGRLIDIKAVEKVEAHIADAVKKDAKVAVGGKRSALGGTFFEPTVQTDATADMVVENLWPGGAALRGFLAPRHRPFQTADSIRRVFAESVGRDRLARPVA